MRLVALSDTHGQHSQVKVPDGDVLIHCGDFCKYGRLDEFKDFIAWMEAQPHRYKVFTAGNHDGIVEENLEICRALVPDSINMLLDEMVVIMGRKFYGSPWTPEFCDWWFMKDRDKISQVWRQIPEGTEVLITHGPPYGHGDLVPSYIGNNWPRSVGCFELMKRVIEVNPRFHFFGHIHAGYGITHSDIVQTVFVNCATCDESYLPNQKPQVVDLYGIGG